MNGTQKTFIAQVFAGISVIVAFITFAVNAKFTTSQLALYVGFFIGVAGKVLLPYIRKIEEGKIEGFEAKYFWTAIITFLYMIPVNLTVITGLNVDNLPWLYCVWLGICIGFGGQSFTNEAYKYFQLFLELYKKAGVKTDNFIPTPFPSDTDTSEETNG
jgi:drug/metabolite transporter (DMT)-like permease